jgi:hypothetical protein
VAFCGKKSEARLFRKSDDKVRNVLVLRWFVQEINVKLWRNHQQQDWSVEINGTRHDSLTIESIEELMARALIDAEKAMLSDIGTRPN